MIALTPERCEVRGLQIGRAYATSADPIRIEGR
jgi:hypothetical protein